MTKVLILTAGFGEGHNAAARNLSAAFDTLLGPKAAHVADLYALASPRLNALLRRAYLGLINGSPKTWSAFYAWVDRSQLLPRGLWALARERRLLADLIAREKPDVICSTFPVYAFMLERLTLEHRLTVPHFNVVTDSISINSLWWRAACTGWFVPNADSAEVMLKAGVEPARVHVCGFPTPAFIAENADLSPPDLAAGGRPRVLYIINSGTRGAAETARLLLAEPGWEITCAVGRDDGLRRHLQQYAARRSDPAQILGWTDQIPRLLLTHHLLVSKAGGATTQEAIAARCPMIVNQIVPGQEEGNYELLRRHSVGALATTPDAVISACRRAFAWNGAVWRDWRAALENLSRPDAAQAIALQVLAQIGRSPAPRPPGNGSTGAFRLPSVINDPVSYPLAADLQAIPTGHPTITSSALPPFRSSDLRHPSSVLQPPALSSAKMCLQSPIPTFSAKTQSVQRFAKRFSRILSRFASSRLCA
jgi:processive 1,2-diacylglycerol beta-glucosyltransferase